MTTDIIAQAEAALDGASDDWQLDGDRILYRGGIVCVAYSTEQDARFIAWTRAGVPALLARVRELEGERDAFANSHTYQDGQYLKAKARAEAAEAKLAEVEKERQKLEIDLATVLAREANSFTRHDAKMQAAEATVATLTAQVEAMRGALEKIAGSEINSFMIDARIGPNTVSDNRRYCDAPDVARLLKIARAAVTTEKTNG
jgi:hypothetical protein